MSCSSTWAPAYPFLDVLAFPLALAFLLCAVADHSRPRAGGSSSSIQPLQLNADLVKRLADRKLRRRARLAKREAKERQHISRKV